MQSNQKLRQEFIQFVQKNREDDKQFREYEKVAMSMQSQFYDKCNKYQKCDLGEKELPYIINDKSLNVVCVGDLHGDYCAAIECLKLAGIISQNRTEFDDISKFRWMPQQKNTIVVQTGDIIDGKRVSSFPKEKELCQSYLKIINLFDHLNAQSACNLRGKGRIYKLYGNHEMMNLQGNFKNVSQNEMQEFQKAYTDYNDRKSAFAPGSQFATRLGCTTNGVLMIVNDTLFVHGGVSDYFVKMLSKGLNKRLPIRYIVVLVNDIFKKHTLGISLNSFEKTVYKLVLDSDGPTWFRGLGKPKHAENACRIVEKVLDPDIKNIVIGHTIQKMFITGTRCSSKQIFRIDVGMSFSFGKRQLKQTFAQILIFQGKQIYAKYQRGHQIKSRLWNENTGTWSEN